jgi:hypothetical protein
VTNMTIKAGDFVMLKESAAKEAGFTLFQWKWEWEVMRVTTDEFGTTLDLRTHSGRCYTASVQDCMPYEAPEVRWGSPVSGNHDPMDYAYDGCEDDEREEDQEF